MITIKNDIVKEIIINKSKFIGILKYIDSKDDINKYMNEIKCKYPNATHYCYSYIIDNIKRFSDDKEPGGTAGMPILNVIENNNLNHILMVVVRYFGGIKLGAGGLVRAYSKITADCVNLSSKCFLEDGYTIDIKFNYNEIKEIENILKNKIVINKVFDIIVTYRAIISKDEYKNFTKYNTSIINEVKIKRDC